MGRLEKNNVDYFPFICEEGKKMYYIEEAHGNDGFAVFIKILRELAKTDFHYLDLSDETTMMYMSAKCKVTIEKLELIIEDLVKLKKFDKVLWKENSIIWCQDFIDNIQDAYSKRNNNCMTYKDLLLRLRSLGIHKQGKSSSEVSINTHSIVKDSIKEDIIEENSIYYGIDFFKEEFKKIWFEEFLPLKKKKKASVTDRALKSQLKKINKFSAGNYKIALEILEKSVNSGWADFYELNSTKKETTNDNIAKEWENKL